MENSIEHLNPSQLKRFVKKLCLVSNRYSKKQKALSDLNSHLKKLSKSSKPSELKTKIDNVLTTEKQILKSKTSKSHDEDLKKRIHKLENELKEVTKEKDDAINKNKGQISELTISLLSVKTRLSNFIEEKKERDKKLERKIKRKVS